jgi:hypothetical protein
MVKAEYDPETGMVALGWLRLSEEDAMWAAEILSEEVDMSLRRGHWPKDKVDQCQHLINAVTSLRNARKQNV